MSFSINTNTLAMNAMSALNNTNDMLGASMNRLSTGLRINNAADDPAGFMAAQQMQSQIGGMNQALLNTQQAMNYAKTAGGAFTTINSLLNTARALAIAAANTSTQSSTEIQADQQQLSSIVASISNIAKTTQYGNKNLLDGSAGINAAITSTSVSQLQFTSGKYNGVALTASSTVTLTSLTAATQATVASQAYGTLASTVAAAGSFSINGSTFTATATNTAGDLVNMINAASAQTGVSATFTGAAISLKSIAYGTKAAINLVDTGGVFKAAGSYSATGTDANAVLSVNGTAVNYTSSLQGSGGLTLSDSDGNQFTLTASGNVTTAVAAAIGQVIVGTSQFQVGANSGQTATLALGNYSASNLGLGAVAGENLGNIDVTTATGASNALAVIDKAIQDVTQVQGTIGNFQTNVLQVDAQNLTTATTNLNASLSTVQDTNIAQEMTQYTKLQILEQSGMSILAQANQLPSQILSLIKAG